MLFGVKSTLFEKLARFSVQLQGPWLLAKFYVGWEEYRAHGAYKDRVVCVGFKEAFYMFFNGSEWKYYFKKSVERNPILYWQVLFFPWAIEVPPLLQAASRSGMFEGNYLKGTK